MFCKIQGLSKTNTLTQKELLAVKYVLDSFGEMLQKQYVQANMDKFSACRILSVGSSKAHLRNIAVDVFTFCSKFSIKSISQWITREQNELADCYRRIKETDHWSIDYDSFRLVNNLYDPFTVNKFENNLYQRLK